jgi:hypothetical protein
LAGRAERRRAKPPVPNLTLSGRIPVPGSLDVELGLPRHRREARKATLFVEIIRSVHRQLTQDACGVPVLFFLFEWFLPATKRI